MACPAYAAQPERYVALTFDDGPSGRFTRALLDGLAQRNVKATFLLCGYRLRDYPKEAARIQKEGHEIGLHGYSHSSMADMDQEELEREIADTLALLPEGCRPVFLRPPGGKCSERVKDAARQADLAILSWSVDPKDWAVKDASAIKSTVLSRVKDGDIVLLHDMSTSSVDAALAIADSLLEEGYALVTVSELARLRGLRPAPGRMYTRFPPGEQNVK